MVSIKKLADAIYNDVVGGLRGYHTNQSISMEQLQQEVIWMRLSIIKDFIMKGNLPVLDLLLSLNCIPVDCDSLDKCRCGTSCGKPIAHFQIPQIIFDFGLNKAIQYIGSSDRQHPFSVYTSALDKVLIYLKYKKRGKNKPWVYIDVTPNSEGLLDGYIFNAPLIKLISITAIFKDPRQLEGFVCDCENSFSDDNFSFIDNLIKEKLTKEKLYFYRQVPSPIEPNNLEYKA